MNKELTVPKWVQTKISQMPQNLSAQFVCPSPKVWDFDEKKASLGVGSPCCVWFIKKPDTHITYVHFVNKRCHKITLCIFECNRRAQTFKVYLNPLKII